MIRSRHDHNGLTHMVSERDGAVIFLPNIMMLWQGESQRSKEHSEESCQCLSLVCESKYYAVITRASLYMVADGLSLLVHLHARMICMGMASVLCGLLIIYALTCPHLLNVGRVAQGTGAIHVVNRERGVFNGWVLVVGDGLDWWTEFVTNETLLGLDAQIPVMDVVDFRWYLCLHQGFDGIFLDGTALLTSIPTAKKRPPPEPPPAWWISPEPPPSAYDTVLLVTGLLNLSRYVIGFV